MRQCIQRSDGEVWKGYRSPYAHYGVWDMPTDKVSKINFEIAYIQHFLQSEMVSPAVSACKAFDLAL